MDIVEHIRSLSKERGMSLYELSQLAGISEATVYAWKARNSIPTIAILEKICKALGITVFQFFNGFQNETLSKDQAEVLEKWIKLTERQKQIINEIINSYIELNIKNF